MKQIPGAAGGGRGRRGTSTTWQRRARLIVGVGLVGFSIVLYRAIRPREAPAPRATESPREDPASTGQIARGVVTFRRGETFAFDRNITYQDGRSKAFDVTLKVTEETGRLVTVTAREAERRETRPGKAGELGEVVFRGDVKVVTSDGFHLTTAEATYNDIAQIVSAPGAVAFDRGRMRGTGVGATYDRQQDAFWLLDQAHIVVAPDPTGAGRLDVTSGAAGLLRKDHQIHFERNVHITGEDRDIDALAAVASLTEDESRVTLVELRGDARVTRPPESPAAPGDVTTMKARDIDLRYREDGRTLSGTTLLAGAVVTLAGVAGTPGRRIAAERLVVEMGTDGATVTALQGQGRVDLTLPAEGDAPTQHIRAATLDARGEDPGGLSTAVFVGDVEYRETAARPAPNEADRVARSTRLEVNVQPGFGAIDAARFIGAVTFTDGAWRGQGPTAQYDPGHGRLALAADADGKTLPQAADDRVTIDALAIALALDDRRLEADGRVRSVMKPAGQRSPSAAAPEAGEQGHMPSLLSGGQPVYVTGAHLVYEGGASLATYTGGSRLWQGDTLIQAEQIVLDDRQGNLSASGTVHTVMALASASDEPTAAGGPPERTIADAEDLVYEDATRLATYRRSAHLTGPAGDLKGTRIEVTLAEGEGKLDRVEAFEDVTGVLEERFTTTGSHLTYFAGDGRYLVEGTPVRVIERRPTECQETIGTILTFTRSTDNINVEGTDGSRSRTRPVPCPERRP